MDLKIPDADINDLAADNLFGDLFDCLNELTQYTAYGKPIQFSLVLSVSFFEYVINRLQAKPSLVGYVGHGYHYSQHYISLCGVLVKKCSNDNKRLGHWFTVTVPTT